ncbi:MAG: DUF1015 family protein [Actinomycetota bacterium]
MTDTTSPPPATGHEPLIVPLRALIVRPELADRVISGPYDAYTASERQAIARREPLSFLNVTRSPDDVDPAATASGEADTDELVGGAQAALARLLAAGAYDQQQESALYLYRLQYDAHSQIGVAGLVPVDAFSDARIRHHEAIRPERAELLARHLLATGATSSPIALSYRADAVVDELVAAAATDAPIVDHEQDGVTQHVWALRGAAAGELTAAIGDRPLYITDGHHRAAAAIQARELVRRGEPSAGPSQVSALDRAFAVLFPDDQLRVLAFHRLVRDSQRRAADVLADDMARQGLAVRQDRSRVEAAAPGPGEVGVYCRGHWFMVELAAGASDRALDALDVERLERQVLEPVFEADPTDLSAVEYLPAVSGVDRFTERCDAADLVGLTMHRTTTAELFAVADQGDLMPPKSSYFAPKPRSGVFLRSLGTGPMAPYGAS